MKELINLGFKYIKTTNDNKMIFKQVKEYDGKFLGVKKDTKILIFNLNSKRVFMNRVVEQGKTEHFEPFCADIELINAIAEFIKNM